MGVRAIDVSRWQGTIDWHAVRDDGVRAAWIKVGGADVGHYRDSRAGANLAGAEAAGVPFGTYYFCHGTPGAAVDQARHAVTCGHGRGALWPAADLETNPAGLSHEQLDIWLGEFCAEVARLTGRESVWYGGYGTGVGFTARAPRCPCWVSNYGTDRPGGSPPAFTPRVPPAWAGFDVWQFNSTTHVPGIPDNTCDQNVITDEFWARMTNNAPPDRKELIMGVPVHCPDHTGDAQWMLVRDGNGRERRRFLGPEDIRHLWALGELTTVESIVWTGGDADWFLAFPEVPPMHAYEAGVANLWQTLAYLRDQVAVPLAQLAGRDPDDVDEAALAAELAGPVATAVATLLRTEGGAVGIDAEKLDELIERVTAAGQALAGAPQA